MSNLRPLALVAAAALSAIVLSGCAAGTPAEPAAPTAGAADCTPAHEFTTINDGVLSIAAMNTPPKFSAATPDGPYDGIDYYLNVAFAEENCLTPDFNPVTPPAATLELQEGRADMIGGLVLGSPARAEVFNLSDRVLFETLGISSKDGYETVGDLVGKKVGVISGSSYAQIMMDAIGADNVVEYQTDVNIFQDIQAGRIDAGAMPSLHGVYLSGQFPEVATVQVADDPEYPEATQLFENVWPSTKGNDALTEAMNAFIAEAHAGGLVKEALVKAGIAEDKADFYLNGR
ncbi:MAG TPA: transporter substrate-binding domain-containing protein [Microbacteriaceae bacterium]|nr:transporter substrate-binding domain-containing protein [Microbacteriaceae bacterium]